MTLNNDKVVISSISSACKSWKFYLPARIFARVAEILINSVRQRSVKEESTREREMLSGVVEEVGEEKKWEKSGIRASFSFGA